ncbi:MAG: hypothetical protein ACYC66_16235 [Chloroflexota bacterium]
MLIGSLISFGVLVLAWMVLPVKEFEAERLVATVQKAATGRQSA